jgi:hypothetical protein
MSWSIIIISCLTIILCCIFTRYAIFILGIASLLCSCISLRHTWSVDIVQQVPTPTTQLVIARYNEDISWLQAPPFAAHKQLIYNKGDSLEPIGDQEIINLPNIGRCDHTYLYHIINNYDTLADVTCFIPGSVRASWIKSEIVERLIYIMETTGNTAFIGHHITLNFLKDFKLDEYAATNADNYTKNPESYLKPCFKRPFGEWYTYNFGNTPLKFVSYYGIFVISKVHVRQHPKEYYEKLIEQLSDSSNPECGHYFERSWTTTFGPIPNECLYS